MTTAHWISEADCLDKDDAIGENRAHQFVCYREDIPEKQSAAHSTGTSISVSGGAHAILSVLKNRVRFARVAAKIHALRTMTAELFVGDINIEIESDPEIPDANYFVLNVQSTAPLEEVAALRKEWYTTTYGLLGADCEMVRLSVDLR